MATLTVDLDDQATDALSLINDTLDQMALTTVNAAKSVDIMTASQTKHIAITHEETVAWIKLGEAGVTAVDHIATEGIKAFAELELATEHVIVQISGKLIEAGASIWKFSQGAATAAYVAELAFNRNRKAIQGTAEAADEASEHHMSMFNKILIMGGATALSTVAIGKGLHLVGSAAEAASAGATSQYNLMGYAAVQAGYAGIKTFTGLWLEVLAAEVAIKAYSVVLDNTGIRMKTLADGTQVFESNLDRANAAGSAFAADIAADITASGQVLADWWNTPMQWPVILKDAYHSVDATITRGNDNMVENIGLVNRAYRSMVDNTLDGWNLINGDQTTALHLMDRNTAAYIKFGGVQSDINRAYKSEAQYLRDMAAETEKIRVAQEKSADGFAMLGRANQELTARQEYRAEQARVASIKTQDAITGEIQALKLKAQAVAVAGKFDAAAKEEYYQKMDALELRSLAIEKERATHKEKAHAAQKVIYSETERLMDVIAKKSQEAFDMETKFFAHRNEMARDLIEARGKQNVETQLGAGKEQLKTNKEIVKAQLEAQGKTETEIKTRLAAMDMDFANAEHALKIDQINSEAKAKYKVIEEERWKLSQSKMDDEERRKAEVKIKEQELKIAGDRIKKNLEENGRFAREQNKITVEDHRQGELQKFKDEKDRIEKLKKLNDEQVKANFDPRAAMDASDPRKVLQKIQEARAREAQQSQADKDVELYKKGMGGDDKAAKRYMDNQKAAAAKAKRQAMEDADNGNLKQGEIGQAQGQVATETMNTLQKQGKLNSDQVKVMQDAIKTLADQQQSLDNMANTMAQLIAAQKGQKIVARQTVTATQNQQGSLN